MRSRSERTKRGQLKLERRSTAAMLAFTAKREGVFQALLDTGHKPTPRPAFNESSISAFFWCNRCSKRWPGRFLDRFFGLSPKRPCESQGSGDPQAFAELIVELEERIASLDMELKA